MANPACWVKEYIQMSYIAKGDIGSEINAILRVTEDAAQSAIHSKKPSR